MKISQHGKNLWQLTRLFAFNCFLVRESDGLTLVDAGLGDTSKEILQAAQTIGLPITRITLTHAHGDHVGALDPIALQFPQAEVAFTRRTAGFLQGNLALQPGEPQVPLRGSFQTRTTQPTRFLVAGERVGSLRVVASPGHTPDHVAFFDERDGTLIAGDAFQTAAGIAVAGVRRWLFPFPAMATWHLPTALDSARALRALQPTRLATGHGRVLESPGAQMDAALAVAEAKVRG